MRGANKIKLNYNDTFATKHSRDYYRGESFHYAGEWLIGAHYISDDYNVDFVVHDQVLLACAKSHLSTAENEPKDFIRDERGTIIGIASIYWDFVLSGIQGNSCAVKIKDNYWWICNNANDSEEEQIWINTGVKAKMELSDLTPEEIALLQEPGKQVVTEFVQHTMVQTPGQNVDKIMSQKAVTDELSSKATKGELSAAIVTIKQESDSKYQLKGDYATNTKVDHNKELVDIKFEDIDSTINDITDELETEETTRASEIIRVEGLISSEVSQRTVDFANLTNKINNEIQNRVAGDLNLEGTITTINSKIPSEASNVNQLADKAFVHSEVSTNTATFRGTYDTLEELQEQEADNNDYGFVITTDSLGNTIYSRYKYNGTEWIWEYDITSTEFTQYQWDAINSGVNSSLISKLNGVESGAQVNIIDGVKVNNVDLSIVNKKVNVIVPTKTSDITNDSGFVSVEVIGKKLIIS